MLSPLGEARSSNHCHARHKLHTNMTHKTHMHKHTHASTYTCARARMHTHSTCMQTHNQHTRVPLQEAALKWLSKAERLYHEQRSHAQQHRAPPLQPTLEPSSASAGASTAAGTAPTSSGACEPVDLGEVLEAGYTLTVFSLAQVCAPAPAAPV